MQYFKILERGGDGKLHSCFRGTHTWEPDTWYTSKGILKICENGFHATEKPYMWLQDLRYEVWKANVEGVQGDPNDDSKVMVRRIKITEKVPDPQWLTDAKAMVKWIGTLPAKYFVARDAAQGAAWNAAQGAARNAAWNAAWGAAWGAARGAARNAAWGAARDAAWGAAWFVSGLRGMHLTVLCNFIHKVWLEAMK